MICSLGHLPFFLSFDCMTRPHFRWSRSALFFPSFFSYSIAPLQVSTTHCSPSRWHSLLPILPSAPYSPLCHRRCGLQYATAVLCFFQFPLHRPNQCHLKPKTHIAHAHTPCILIHSDSFLSASSSNHQTGKSEQTARCGPATQTPWGVWQSRAPRQLLRTALESWDTLDSVAFGSQRQYSSHHHSNKNRNCGYAIKDDGLLSPKREKGRSRRTAQRAHHLTNPVHDGKRQTFKEVSSLL